MVLQRQKWHNLSPRTRKLVVVGTLFEGVLKLVALMDLKRRPAAKVKGSKARWTLAVLLVNSVGAVPIAYLLYGRRR
jgi:hypothetical protein